MATVTTLNVVAAQENGAGRKMSETTLRLQRTVKSLERVAECCDCSKAMLEVLVLLNASIKGDKGLADKLAGGTAPVAKAGHVVAKTGSPVTMVSGMSTGYCWQDKAGRRFHSDEIQEVS